MNTMMRGGLLPAVALFIVLLAAVGVACDGGDEEGTTVPSPGATGTPAATPSALEEQLSRMVLQLPDVPAGFTLERGSFSSNEDVAAGSDDPQASLAKLNEWGRLLGHGVTYTSPTSDQAGVLLVDSTVSLYESDSGAAASFADAVNSAHSVDWSASAEGTDVQVEELPPLDVGEEMMWLRVSGTALAGEPATEQAFVQDIVLWRLGRARGSLTVAATDIEVAPLVETMVRAQAANMTANLP